MFKLEASSITEVEVDACWTEIEGSIIDSLKVSEGKYLTLEITSEFREEKIPVHSNPLIALPTIAVLIHAAVKSLSK